MAAMDAEMIIGLAVRAGQAVGVEQTDEFVVAGVLVHEVGQGEIHGGVSRGSIGLHRMISQILVQSSEAPHRIRLISQIFLWTLSVLLL